MRLTENCMRCYGNGISSDYGSGKKIICPSCLGTGEAPNELGDAILRLLDERAHPRLTYTAECLQRRQKKERADGE